MSLTVAQIYALNPSTTVNNTDLFYLVQSPYTPGTDSAILGSDLKTAFGIGTVVSVGSGTGLTGGPITTTGTLSLIVPVLAINGGTGVVNPGTITVGGNVTFSGAFTFAGTVTGNTAVTFPTSGTLATTAQLPVFPISPANGGTGINNGTSTITIGGNTAFIGAFTFAGTVTGNTAVTFPTSGTLATTSQLITSPLTTKGDLWGFTSVDARLAVGTTNGQVLQVASGATIGLAYSTATYPTVATSAARILRADGTNWVQTTSTFADTYTASSILYANGVNNVAGLTTANNGLLVTGNTGIPVMLAGPGTTGNMLISNAAAAPSFTTFTYPTTVGATGSIHISNGTNIVSSTSLWPNTVGTNGKFIISDGTTNGYSTSTIPTSAGATANKHLISDGTNYVLSTPTFPNSASGTGTILRADGTNWVATTSTYPNTNAINTLLYASSANVMSALATANSGVLVTSSGGVPSISTTLPSGIAATNMALTTPAFTGIPTGTVTSGSYTPTISNISNVSSSAAAPTLYSRVGNMVTVCGSCNVDAITTLTVTQIRISLPIASNIGSTADGAGVIVSSVAGAAGRIEGESGSDTVQCQWVPVSTANDTYGFTFMYQVI